MEIPASAPRAPAPLLEQRLAPQVTTLWRLQRVFRLALFGLPVSVGIGMAIATVAPVGLAVGATVLFAGVQLIGALVWPALEYAAFRYSVREDDLLVSSGVLFRHWTVIPHHRIQHVDTRQGPLERALGLARLLVFTASGMSADGSITGLALEDAERLRDMLSRRGGDDGV